ncbi:MAG TPA: hypothetical protein VLJ15_01610 [Gammaproteobacteria bacterium]|nr:hypothetical protein [Gammaproteobacteria bacterium]
MFKFFEQNAKRVLSGAGYFAGLSALVYVDVLLEARRRKALQDANPDCDVVSEWRPFGLTSGYDHLSLKPKQAAGQKEPSQTLRRP